MSFYLFFLKCSFKLLISCCTQKLKKMMVSGKVGLLLCLIVWTNYVNSTPKPTPAPSLITTLKPTGKTFPPSYMLSGMELYIFIML